MSTLLQLWREVCGRSPALVNPQGKHLIVGEADLILLGSEIERAMLAAAPTPAAQSAGQESVELTDELVSATLKEYQLALQTDPRNTEQMRNSPTWPRVVDSMQKGAMREALTFALGRSAVPVNGGERERAIEEAAQIADTFKCGTCGMDGKCAAEIRKLKGKRAADAQQVGAARYEKVDGCKDCRHAHYYSADRWECLKEKRMFDALGRPNVAPDWCPLPALTSPVKDAQRKPMTDRQIIELCKSVGVEWEGPDMCDFMGDFGRVNMAGMRAVIAAAKEQK